MDFIKFYISSQKLVKMLMFTVDWLKQDDVWCCMITLYC